MSRPIHIKGIEILDNESIPPGEIWMLCPMQNGGKVRYMFSLTDHRMTQPGSSQCFFLDLQGWLDALRNDLIDDSPIVLDRLDLILEAMTDFKTGKDPRTVEL